jgi:hypothetical protein
MVPTENKTFQNKRVELDGIWRPWKNPYQDISDYLSPGRGDFDESRSDPDVTNVLGRFRNNIDNTGTYALTTLGAMMQGGLADSTTQWFKVGLMDEDLEQFGPVRDYLSAVEQVMYKVFEGSNFYQTVQTGIEEQGGFGSACVIAEEHDEMFVNYRVSTCGEYRLALGADGFVDTVYRTPKMTAREIVQMFGEKAVSDNVLTAFKKTPFKYFQVVQVIEPNKDFVEGSPFPTEMEFTNYWYEPTSNDKFLLNSGYNEQPFAAPRWSVLGNIPYGFSPGILTVGKIKMLQEFEKESIRGIHLMNNPAMGVTGKYKGRLSTIPGAWNTIDAEDMGKAIAPLYRVDIRWKDLEFKIDSIQGFVKEAFYNHLFQILNRDDPRKTATQIVEEGGEKLILLGPVVRRQIKEFFDPTMERTFSILQRRDRISKDAGFGGLFPDPPQELANARIKMRYESTLARAMEGLNARAISIHTSYLERMMLIDPKSVVASSDFLQLISMHAEAVNVPTKGTRSVDDATAILDGINAAEAKQQEENQALEASQAVKNLGQAPVGDGTALDAIAEGAELNG